MILLIELLKAALKLIIKCFIRVYIFLVSSSSGNFKALKIRIHKLYFECSVKNSSMTDFNKAGSLPKLLITKRILSKHKFNNPVWRLDVWLFWIKFRLNKKSLSKTYFKLDCLVKVLDVKLNISKDDFEFLRECSTNWRIHIF